MKKTSSKVVAFTVFVVLVLAFFLVSTFLISQDNLKNKIFEQTSVMLNDSFDRLIKSEVETVISNIKSMHEHGIENGLSEDDIKKNIVEYIRNIRYGDNGYFWIDDTSGNNILSPTMTEVEGTNRMDTLDSHNNSYMKEIITTGMNGGGFTEYYFPKLGEQEASPKRAYSQEYKPFNWVIGTGNYVDDIQTVLYGQEKEIQTNIDRYRLISIVVTIILVIILSIISYFLARKLLMPITKLTQIVKKIANGDLTVQVESTSQDEIGELASSFNIMINNIKDITKDTSELSKKLKQSFYEIENIAEDVTTGSEETAKTITDLATGITSQALATDTANKNILNIADNLQLMTDSMDEAQKQANDSIQAIEKGKDTIDIQQDKMAVNKEASNNISEAISNMSKVTNEIVSVVDVINEISHQTNLLALNAAIEAARAGESGKGFAVVAEEIRKLAEQTMVSTKKISSIIEQVTESVQVAVTEIDSVSESVNEQEIALKESIVSFEEIANAVKVIIDKVDLSAEKSAQINQDIQDTSKEMNNIASIAEVSAASTQEVSATTQEQTAQISQVNQYIKDVSELVDHLSQSIQRFTT